MGIRQTGSRMRCDAMRCAATRRDSRRCGSMFFWAGWHAAAAGGGAGGSTGGAHWARASRPSLSPSLVPPCSRLLQGCHNKAPEIHTCPHLPTPAHTCWGCSLRLHCPGTPRPLIVACRTIQFDVQLVGAVTGCLQPCLLRVGPLAAQPLPSVCLFTSTRSSAAATRLDIHNNRHLHHHHHPLHPHPLPHPPPTTLPHGPLILVPARSLNMPPPS